MKYSGFIFAISTCMLMSFLHLGQKKPLHDDLGLFLPDDLEVSLWAESPMFFNPTNMDVDAKGRIWVTEAVNYRNFNNDSTKLLHHTKGDRVIILEDTDRDGKADKSTVFTEDRDLVSPLGIAVIGNKVIVSCAPNLIVYTDDNGDDKPDRKEILLTGFGGFDHDHALHAVVGSPDGKWHFNTGNAGPHVVSDKSGWTLRSGSSYNGGTPYNNKNRAALVSDDGRIWVGGVQLEINPDGTGLRPVAHGFRNSYETYVDSYGDMWQNDNDDQVVTCRVSWLMEGGNAGYFSADGSRFWQADQRPGQDMFTAHWHQEDPGVMPAGDNSGAGSPTGVVLNEGDGLGSAYRGTLFSADAGRNLVFGYKPQLKGSGFDLKGKRTNFITSLPKDNEAYVWNDKGHQSDKRKWFRPSDVMMGTDGAMYIADWYDPVVGGHQMKDSIGYGRIYRITPKGKNPATPLIDFNTENGLLEALKSPAINVRAFGFERARALGSSVNTMKLVNKLLSSENPYHHARAAWLLNTSDSTGQKTLEQWVAGKDTRLGVVAFRALRQSATKPQLLKLISQHIGRSSFLDREMAIALRDFSWAEKKALIERISNRYNGDDDYLLETIGIAAEHHEEELYAYLTQKNSARLQNAPQHWIKTYARLVWRLHPVSSVPTLKAWIVNPSIPLSERKRAMTALAFINDTKAAKSMLEISNLSNKLMSDQAKYWLAFRQGNDWANLLDWKKVGFDVKQERHLASMIAAKARILNVNISVEDRCRTASQMANDEVGGRILLGLGETNSIPIDIQNCVIKGFAKNPDLGNRLRADKLFSEKNQPVDLGISAEKEIKVSADYAKGKNIFMAKCSSCHRTSNGGSDIGPDLTYIGKKLDQTSILNAIKYPNTSIVFGYEPWIIDTKSGESFYGFLIADGKTIIIKDLSGKKYSIPALSVIKKKKQESSIMPNAKALALNEEDLAHLTRYLVELK
jgi:putative membrane-bound dehydrogenase-like protein